MWFKKKQVLCTNCGFLGWEYCSPDDGRRLRSIECVPYWRNRIRVDKDLGSLEDSETGEGINIFCIRGQWVFNPHMSDKESRYIDIDNLIRMRNCNFYTKYEPSFSPMEHKELLRDTAARKTIFKATLLGAVVGACAAIIAQILYIIFVS